MEINTIIKRKKPKKNEMMKVAKVLNSRTINPGKTEYLIQWDGLGPEHNSWEPQKYLNKMAIASYYEEIWRSQELRDEIWNSGGNNTLPGTGKLIKWTFFNEMHPIPWGGTTMINGRVEKFTNTCPIDNGLQIIYALYNIHPLVKDYLNKICNINQESSPIQRNLVTILKLLEDRSPNSAKLVWINIIMKWDWNKSTSFLGSEETYFMDYLIPFCTMNEIPHCQNPTCITAAKNSFLPPESSGIIKAHTPKDFEEIVNYGRPQGNEKCLSCSNPITILKYSFPYNEPLPFIVFSAIPRNNRKCLESHIPHFVTLHGFKYNIFAYTLITLVSRVKHFITIFKVGQHFFKYDGLRAIVQRYVPNDKNRVNFVWLVLA